jgi:thioredoxin-related protein
MINFVGVLPLRRVREMAKHISFWLLLLALFSLPTFADPPDGYAFVSYDEGLAQAKQNGRPLFLYFGRYGCGWCEKTNREAFSDKQLHRLYSDHYVLVYVDAESGKRLTLPSGERITERELGVRMKVLVTPVFAWLERDGREIFHIPGIQSAGDFLLYDRFVSEGHYRKENIRDFLARELR